MRAQRRPIVGQVETFRGGTAAASCGAAQRDRWSALDSIAACRFRPGRNCFCVQLNGVCWLPTSVIWDHPERGVYGVFHEELLSAASAGGAGEERGSDPQLWGQVTSGRPVAHGHGFFFFFSPHRLEVVVHLVV